MLDLRRILATLSTSLVAVLALVGAPVGAQAFCGFYVSGADGQLFNNATQVVLMRAGTRTVLSMQNAYKGPVADFAMVVPVPVVLQKHQVKILSPEVFERLDRLSAPRLVEYWEQDPCAPPEPPTAIVPSAVGATRESGVDDASLGVKVEAQFEVGEYQIVILSARDSTGLDTWLRKEQYRIPEGAAPYLQPYVESGSKFFVAKVDTTKVRFENGQAMLSPLRFHYESVEFSLPVRLGMMNSEGTQDLIVHILADSRRYEVANYPNVTIPTNIDVSEETRERFGEFYAALFDSTLEKNPGAVVTEYAWSAGSCDPCPTPPLTMEDALTLGHDVARADGRDSMAGTGNLVLTRLHARYGKDALGEDLVFREAPPVVGGREFVVRGKLEQGAQSGGVNNFQGRYAIRHPWTGAIDCPRPRRGIWGGPPEGTQAALAATQIAFAPRGQLDLAQAVRSAVPELGLEAAARTRPPTGDVHRIDEPAKRQSSTPKGCGCQSSTSGGPWSLVLVATLLFWRRRRLRSL